MRRHDIPIRVTVKDDHGYRHGKLLDKQRGNVVVISRAQESKRAGRMLAQDIAQLPGIAPVEPQASGSAKMLKIHYFGLEPLDYIMLPQKAVVKIKDADGMEWHFKGCVLRRSGSELDAGLESFLKKLNSQVDLFVLDEQRWGKGKDILIISAYVKDQASFLAS